MSQLQFMKGNEAMAEAAILAGCKYYFGYPITPQNEVPAYMAKRMPEIEGVFIQAESEVAAINMVFGAAVTGARAMTSSSSPGISLKQEGISYMAACELPGVIANIQRGGPGLGSIGPSQADYWQATRGGGHGDYRTIVLAPHTIDEVVGLTMDAFDLADYYRNPVVILSDGLLGQMMEKVEFPNLEIRREQGLLRGREIPIKDWILTGSKNREPRKIRSLLMKTGELEEHNYHLADKYQKITQQEATAEEIACEDAELIIIAYGSPARLAKQAQVELAKQGKRIGVFRPITLWPFPTQQLAKWTSKVNNFLVVEMSLGQMLEDVKLSLGQEKSFGSINIQLLAKPGGAVPLAEDIQEKIIEVLS